MENQQIIKIIQSALLSAMFFVSCNVYAEVNMDTDYSTGSAKADKELAEYIEGAKRGSPFAHAYLGMVYCGELCMKPKYYASDDDKKILSEQLAKINTYGVKPDYVKSYAHFMLSDNFKGGYDHYRRLLAAHMAEEQVNYAKVLSANWQNKSRQ